MKKLYVIIFSLILIWGCTPAQETSTKKHFISGTAAVGTYMPDGSAVELRAAPVKTGNQIIVGYYPDGSPDYQDETTPSEIRTATVTGGQGEYTVDVTGLSEPYIVRVQCGGRWYYSYADGNSDTANVNPYSDWMIRSYYLGVSANCPGAIEIDNKFASGIMDIYDYSDNAGQDIVYTKWSYGFDKTGRVWHDKSLPIPDADQINRSMSQLQYIFEQRYSIDIGDILTRDWVIGETYDSILDSSTIDWDFIKNDLMSGYYFDDMVNKWQAYYYDSGTKFHVDIYSDYEYVSDLYNGTLLTEIEPGHFAYDGVPIINPLSGESYLFIGIRVNNVPYTPQTTGSTFTIMIYNQ